MFAIIGLMLAGILLGCFLRGRNLKKIRKVITVLIWLLLFILGMEVGGNERIMEGLRTIGREAFLLAIGGTLGSVVAAWGLWKILHGKKGGRI